MLIGELCRRLEVDPRHAKYVMEEGFLPKGATREPGTGHHRDLSPSQAFWLAIVLLLKQSGVRMPLAAKIADYSRESVRTVARQLGWDPGFNPFVGQLETKFKWYSEVGDLKFIRFVTDAHPSKGGDLVYFDWKHLATGHMTKDFTPAVTMRIDLSRIAELVRGQT